MALPLDQPINVTDNIYYIIASQHRLMTNQHKSFWIISPEGELDCFQLTISKGWYQNNRGWGLCLSTEGKLNYLGKNNISELLKIAKFIDSVPNNHWHGYPADYRRKTQDIPPIDILKEWYDEGLLEKHCISKIKAGKVCNL